jgi:hypothetical protein
LIKNRNTERILIALGSFLLAIIIWSTISSSQKNKPDPVSVLPTPEPKNDVAAPPSTVTPEVSSASSPIPTPSSATNNTTPSSQAIVPSPDTSLPDSPRNYSVRGSLNLIDSRIGGTPNNCYGTGGYDDIQAGMSVTVRDGNGNILATGKTGSGFQPGNSEYSIVQCIFEFQIDNVPKSDFYSIEVQHRGELNFSFEELQKKNWEVSFSLS